MSLKQWEDNGWLKPHRTSRKVITWIEKKHPELAQE